MALKRFAGALLRNPDTLTTQAASDLPDAPFRAEFQSFPWRKDARQLKAWRRGMTGYPIVDAGMRELWATGWMHNRARVNTASLLIKEPVISVAGRAGHIGGDRCRDRQDLSGADRGSPRRARGDACRIRDAQGRAVTP